MSNTIKGALIALLPALVLALVAWGSMSTRQTETEKRVDRLESEWGHRFDRLESKLDRLIEQGNK